MQQIRKVRYNNAGKLNAALIVQRKANEKIIDEREKWRREMHVGGKHSI